MSTELSPCDIRFMHHSINANFRKGASLNAVIEKITRGEMSVHQLRKIKVVKLNKSCYAFDNRRLYVYRVLHHRRLLDKISVHVAPLSEFQIKRFSTKNYGKSVTLKSGITLPHSFAEDVPQISSTVSDGNANDIDRLLEKLTLENRNEDDSDDLYDKRKAICDAGISIYQLIHPNDE